MPDVGGVRCASASLNRRNRRGCRVARARWLRVWVGVELGGFGVFGWSLLGGGISVEPPARAFSQRSALFGCAGVADPAWLPARLGVTARSSQFRYASGPRRAFLEYRPRPRRLSTGPASRRLGSARLFPSNHRPLIRLSRIRHSRGGRSLSLGRTVIYVAHSTDEI